GRCRSVVQRPTRIEAVERRNAGVQKESEDPLVKPTIMSATVAGLPSGAIRRAHTLRAGRYCSKDSCDEFPGRRESHFMIPVASDPTMRSARAGPFESDRGRWNA